MLCQQYAFNVSQDIAISMKIFESEMIHLQNLVETTGEEKFIVDLSS